MGQGLLHKIEEFEKPIIAAINGFALGGGTEISMACDIRIASERAKFGQPEVKLGIIPGFGGTQRLPRLVGRGMAKLLIFSGKMIDAQEALRIGLVEKVVPHEQLMAETKAIAAAINAMSPTAVRLAKASINHGLDVDMRTGNRFEAFAFGHCFATEDQIEGMTCFIEKREPVFPNIYRPK
jgi:enoyl-CoA hydratase